MGKWMHTATAKVLGIAVLALLMTIPLAQVDGLVRERQQLRADALAQIAQGWGGQQVLGGPVLVVPTRRPAAAEGQAAPAPRLGSESVLADSLKLDVAMAVSTRHYGIYAAPVFVATVQIDARFRAEDLAQFRQASEATWQGGHAELTAPRIRPARFVSAA